MKKRNRKTKINGTIYCFTNEVNGHRYIGMTKNKLSLRLGTHYGLKASGAPLLVKAFKKYGKEKIRVSILDTANTLGELHDKEIYWIEKLNTKAPNGYNILPGGLNNEAAAEANKEPILCVANNKKYASIVEASESTGIPGHLIGFNCRGRQDTAGGMEFEYLNDKKRIKAEKIKNKRKKNRNKLAIKNAKLMSKTMSKPVLCVEMDRIFKSITEATKLTGIGKRAIDRSLKTKTSCRAGLTFIKIEKGETL